MANKNSCPHFYYNLGTLNGCFLCVYLQDTTVSSMMAEFSSEVTDLLCINFQKSRHISVAATTIRDDNPTAPKTLLLEGVCLIMDTSLYFAPLFNTELFMSCLPSMCSISQNVA
jgi:hypothetical protein